MRSCSFIRTLSSEAGATLAEFAFTLPLLVVILYAIFDFGGALTLKQKLEAAVYEAARSGASQDTRDLTGGTVSTNGSVGDIRDMVARDLTAAGVNDCGLLGGGAVTGNPAIFQWIYTASGNGCTLPVVLTVERGRVLPTTNGGAVVTYVIYTHVRLQYPYQWRLAHVIQFLVPSGTFPASSIITVDANMQNLS